MNGNMSDVTPEISVESGDAVSSFKPFGNLVVPVSKLSIQIKMKECTIGHVNVLEVLISHK